MRRTTPSLDRLDRGNKVRVAVALEQVEKDLFEEVEKDDRQEYLKILLLTA